jgi:ankyrin repeat protein
MNMALFAAVLSDGRALRRHSGWVAIKTAQAPVPESANALLDAGANVNFQDRFGKTALLYVLKKRSAPQYVQMLLESMARGWM